MKPIEEIPPYNSGILGFLELSPLECRRKSQSACGAGFVREATMNYQRILLDIETQQDLFQSGYLVEDTQAIKANVHRLFAWAKANSIPVLSTVLRVRRGAIGPFGSKPHCIEDTQGERKLPGTILPARINLGLLNSTDLASDIFARHQQVIIEKRDTDIFKHARAERLITELGSATFVICGAGIAHGIVQAAVGLRSRGFGVILARDAVIDFQDPLSSMAYLRMEAKGVIFAPTEEIVSPTKQPRRVPFRAPATVKSHR